MTVVGLLHPGEMGAAVGRCLVGNGHVVLWDPSGRSAATASRAAGAGLTACDGIGAMVRDSDVIMSVCPPHAALDVARATAGFRGVYVDANAISPATSRQVAAIVGNASSTHHADRANQAHPANAADSANHADTADYADYADRANDTDYADRANNINHAGYAERANHADYADRADYAERSNDGGGADRANNGDRASGGGGAEDVGYVNRAQGADGAGYVDGGIIGPPPGSPGHTRLYLSGDGAGLVAGLFAGTALDARVVAGPAGAASALKIAYAGWTKGTSALILAVRALARAEGVEDDLVAEWGLSQPSLQARYERAQASAAAKGWRWVGEMEEIAASMTADGLPPGFHLAAADIYRAAAQDPAASPQQPPRRSDR